MNNNNNRRGFGISLSVVVFIILIFVALNMANDNSQSPEFNYSDIFVALAEGKVESIHLINSGDLGGAGTATVTLTPDPDVLGSGGTREVPIPSIGIFTERLHYYVVNHGLTLETEHPNTNSFLGAIFPILLFLLPITLILFIFFRMQGGGGGGNKVMSFGKTRAKAIIDDKRKVTFDNVAGLDEEKQDLQEVVEFLKMPKKFTDIGARIPKGILLVGPPGTGKTLLARAVAGEAGVPFFSISGSDFVEMFVGVGASRVRDLFEQAKKASPCIIFIDEIDAVGRKRGAGLGGGHDEREQTLNQLLVEMDGFGVNEGIIILAATNRPDILDPALLRPGRFDRRVVVNRPDVKGREDILTIHSKGKKLAGDVDLKALASLTSGFTGADLENLLNEAALLAARENKLEVSMAEVRLAFVKVAVGTEKKSRVISNKEKKITAYHEAGHAVIMEVLDELDPVHLISIIPTGMAGGYTMPLPTDDKMYLSKTRMEQEIVGLMGGRAAEYLVIKDITTGASNDIERATAIARGMVTKYGMSDALGPILFGSESEEVFLGRDISQSRNYGEQIATTIDKEIERLVTTGYKQALDILEEFMPVLHETAEALMDKEKLTNAEFVAILDNFRNPKPKVEVIEAETIEVE